MPVPLRHISTSILRLLSSQLAIEQKAKRLLVGIALALAEKVSAMRTEEYFEERARRADPARVNRILARVGKGNPPIEGDELPLEFPARKVRKKK
jgi:hypothetical protein